MSPDEIRFRAGVFVRQRMDARHAARGRNPLDPGRTAQPSARSRFFFDAGSVGELAAEVMCRLPVEAQGVIESANRIAEGRFDLLGYRGLAFGSGNIDWHLDPVHGVRAPFLPWFRVPYLDFRQSGDHKVIWELSRHQHLMLLARAWLYSGDTRFLRTLQSLLRDWHAANPYPYGINWSSTLEVSFRCLSWIWVDHWLADTPEVSDDFRELLRQGIGESASYIKPYISTYFAPNTHLLGEALVLFLVGVLYPEFRPAADWRDYGWSVVMQESAVQVLPDGFHFEQSMYYHVYALEMFLYGRLLAGRNGIAIPRAYDEVLVRMAEGLATTGAGGQAPRFGDDDGGRLFDGRRNRPEFMLDPLATVAAVYGRGDWKFLAGDLREESIWLLGPDGLRAFDALQPEFRPPQSRAFPDSGYHVLASGDAVAVVDGGPHGWGRGGHGHADALSLQLLGRGRAWLTDPGTCSYPIEKPDRDKFRSTAAHNTLEVDGQSQAEPFHSFGWRSHPKTTVHLWYESSGFTVFHASHDGYMRLADPVKHERWVIAWPDRMWLVRDVATGQASHRLDLRWHLGPGCTPAGDNQFDCVSGVIRLAFASEKPWGFEMTQAPWSPAYGEQINLPVAHLFYEGVLPAEHGTVLSGGAPGATVEYRRAGDSTVYVIDRSDRSYAVIFATGPWRFEGLEGDSPITIVDLLQMSVLLSVP